MSLKYSKKEIKAEAKSLGFFACGIVQAMPVDAETATAVRQWISKGQSSHYGLHGKLHRKTT